MDGIWKAFTHSNRKSNVARNADAGSTGVAGSADTAGSADAAGSAGVSPAMSAKRELIQPRIHADEQDPKLATDFHRKHG